MLSYKQHSNRRAGAHNVGQLCFILIPRSLLVLFILATRSSEVDKSDSWHLAPARYISMVRDIMAILSTAITRSKYLILIVRNYNCLYLVCTVWLGTQLTKNMTDGHNLVHPKDMGACTALLHNTTTFPRFFLPQL